MRNAINCCRRGLIPWRQQPVDGAEAAAVQPLRLQIHSLVATTRRLAQPRVLRKDAADAVAGAGAPVAGAQNRPGPLRKVR